MIDFMHKERFTVCVADLMASYCGSRNRIVYRNSHLLER
jgi:hypothetical protein